MGEFGPEIKTLHDQHCDQDHTHNYETLFIDFGSD